MCKDQQGRFWPFYVLSQCGRVDWRGYSGREDGDHVDGASTLENAREVARERFNYDSEITRVLILKTLESCPLDAWDQENELELYEELREKYKHSTL